MKHEIALGAASVSRRDSGKRVFETNGFSYRELARQMGVRPMRVNEIVRGRRAITADTALRLAKALGASARFWMNLQINYDLAIAALAQHKVA